jgi:hypothetical protein
MRFDTVLSPEMNYRLEEIGTTDILMAVVTLNPGPSFKSVVEEMVRAIDRFPASTRTTILISDGGSSDDTGAIAGEIPISIRHEKMFVRYSGPPGKAYALRTVFEIASRLWAKATVVIDPRQRHLSSGDIFLMARPILDKGFDLACPEYRRNPFDAPYVKFLAYPLFRALYGPILKDPAPPDFAFSCKLAKAFFVKKLCESPLAGLSTDLWLTFRSLMEGMRLCPVPVSRWGPDFSEYRVHAFFELMELNPAEWRKIMPPEKGEPAKGFGSIGIPPVKMEMPGLWQDFMRCFSESRRASSKILTGETLASFENSAGAGEEDFVFPPDLWARIVVEFALSYHFRDFDREYIRRTLVPFQIARIFSFFKSLGNRSQKEADDMIEEQARAFERQKPYLAENWK